MHWLAEVINKNQLVTGVEVGAATGLTTGHLLANCPSLKKLYVADDWHPVVLPGHPSYYEGHPWSKDNMEQVFHKVVNGNPRVVVLKGQSWEQAEFVDDRSLDFAFIDASHDYDSVIKDLRAWTPKVKIRGWMCGHDIKSPGVTKAVVELFGKLRVNHTGIDQVWYVRL